jgi:hypothetical protein
MKNMTVDIVYVVSVVCEPVTTPRLVNITGMRYLTVHHKLY